LKKALQITLNY